MNDHAIIVIPVYQPKNTLPAFLHLVHKQTSLPVIVVNDGSNENFDPVFDEIKTMPFVTLLSHDSNCGKGAALKTAFRQSLQMKPELQFVITADSDGQHTPEDIAGVIRAWEKHPGSLVLGCRDFSQPDIPWKSRLGNRISRILFRIFTGLNLPDTQTGLRGIPVAFCEKIITDCPGNRFELETEMLSLAAAEKINIHCHPIRTVYETEHTTHYSPLPDSFRILNSLFRSKKIRRNRKF